MKGDYTLWGAIRFILSIAILVTFFMIIFNAFGVIKKAVLYKEFYKLFDCIEGYYKNDWDFVSKNCKEVEFILPEGVDIVVSYYNNRIYLIRGVDTRLYVWFDIYDKPYIAYCIGCGYCSYIKGDVITKADGCLVYDSGKILILRNCDLKDLAKKYEGKLYNYDIIKNYIVSVKAFLYSPELNKYLFCTHVQDTMPPFQYCRFTDENLFKNFKYGYQHCVRDYLYYIINKVFNEKKKMLFKCDAEKKICYIIPQG